MCLISIGSTTMATLIFGLAAISALVVAQPTVSARNAEANRNAGKNVPYESDGFEVFDWNLYKNLAKKDSGNMIISPISVKIALALLYEGSEGRTAQEIASALQLPNDRAVIRNKFSSIIRSLQTVHEDYTLDIATRLIVHPFFELIQPYRSFVKDFYYADVSMDFGESTASLKDLINDWASKATHGHVKELIADEGVLTDSILIVLNALYFMGSWEVAFSKESIDYGQFFTALDETVDVPYMHTLDDYYYTEYPEVDSHILRLPYTGDKYAMYIVLPHTRTGLQQLIHNVDPISLRHRIRQMKNVQVNLSLPKFKFEFESHLEDVLPELGIRNIFNNSEGTFLSIALENLEDANPAVTSIVQKTGVVVNENGTVAYATTALVITSRFGVSSEITVFNINHPFLFFIEDRSTETMTFIGKVTNPLKSKTN